MEKIRNFVVRFPNKSWKLLKSMAVVQDVSMNKMLIKLVEKGRDKHEKQLTKSSTNVIP